MTSPLTSTGFRPLRYFDAHGAMDWYMYTQGEGVHDPGGLASTCKASAWGFFAEHPKLLQAWREQTDTLRRHRLDPSVPLQFPRQPDFVEHLRQHL